jgi:simple sugar transport system ATP-binding protein
MDALEDAEAAAAQADPRSAADVVLRVHNVSKRFGEVQANSNISFELRRGEVLALLGENGAGKTTLMSIIFGQHVADSGSIEAFGQALPEGSTRAALDAGIGMIHQHFNLAENIDVLENILVGTQPSWSPFLRRRAARAQLNEVMQASGLHVDPDRPVKDLAIGEKQRVEILKALYLGARILILDEPTAVLTPQEAEQLFAIIRELAATGMSVIFISHKLKEVMAISDRVIVLRAGRVVFEAKTGRTNPQELAQQTIGRDLPQRQHVAQIPGESVLDLRNVAVVDHGVRLLDDVTLQVCRHEIVGIAGVSGNGQRTLFNILTGLQRPSQGEVTILGHPARRHDPAFLAGIGVARIPEDRLGTGLLVDLSVWENAIAETYRANFQSKGFIRRDSARALTRNIMAEFDVRCPSPEAPARLLSGGNMQKLILGRSLYKRPQVIIANQPTRGIDVGAVAFVHDRLEEAKHGGAGVLLISEDLDELLAISDRIVVMFRGRASQPLRREDVTVEQLGLMMMGQLADAA